MERYQVYVPPETYVLGPVIKAWRRRRIFGVRYALNQTLGDFKKHEEYRWFPVQDLEGFANGLLTRDKRNLSLESVLDRLYKYWGDHAGIEFDAWGDKTPLNTFYLEEISQVFPKARFVFVCRDALDVCASYVSSGIYSNLEQAAERWTRSNARALSLKDRYPERVFVIRYERLVEVGHSVLDELAMFLELEEREQPIPMEQLRFALGDVGRLPHHNKVLRGVDSQSIGKGRNSMSKGELERLSGIVDPMLIRLGYPTCSNSLSNSGLGVSGI